MHPIPARARGRTRRALLAAACAAVALPGAAEAATIEVFDSSSSKPHAFKFVAAPGEKNDVRVVEFSDGSTFVSDSTPLTIKGDSSLDGCRLNASGHAFCAANASPVGFDLGDGNDLIRYEASESMSFPRGPSGIQGGDGNDTFIAGVRRNAVGRLEFHGGPGVRDKVSYAASPAAVSVSLDSVLPLGANDGHAGDLNHVMPDIEILEGSRFNDVLTGSDDSVRETYIGGPGDDRLTGLGGPDVFDEGDAPSGADTIAGGAGIDLVDYSGRRNRVDVRMDDVARNDGEAGERDFIDPNTNDAFGGSAGDFLAGGAGANVFLGFGGGDALVGNDGNDVLTGGEDVDFLSGGEDNDTIDSVDPVTPVEDTIRCGTEDDTLTRDLRDGDATGCETVKDVGTLGLTPKALVAEAGKAARLRMSWTHPQSWRKLRAVTLRLRVRDAVVGRVIVRPRSERIAAAGAVKLGRATRLARDGKTVRALLALRLDASLSGRRVVADVKAVDTRGRVQLERAAAKVRVS